MEQYVDKIIGTFYGQAIGDAMGLGTEFMSKDEIARHYPHGLNHYGEIIQDKHRSRWKRGDWTDDTDMMLCIAEALIEDKRVCLSSIACNFKEWACGSPMGIGVHTNNVLSIGNYAENPFEVSRLAWEISGRKSAANGGVMRTSVVGLLPEDVGEAAIQICKLTHHDPRCVGSCVIVSQIIHSLVYESREPSYEEIVEWGNNYDHRILEYIDLARNEDISVLQLQASNAMGYTLKTLAAALWAYWHAKSFKDGLLAVVNEGGDADTNAAVACSVLGAKFGSHAIPQEYVDGLVRKEQLNKVVMQFLNVYDGEL